MAKTNPTLKNEAGARYGLLTVIEQAGNRKGGVALWRCSFMLRGLQHCQDETIGNRLYRSLPARD
jgi:hypothetical protein